MVVEAKNPLASRLACGVDLVDAGVRQSARISRWWQVRELLRQGVALRDLFLLLLFFVTFRFRNAAGEALLDGFEPLVQILWRSDLEVHLVIVHAQLDAAVVHPDDAHVHWPDLVQRGFPLRRMDVGVDRAAVAVHDDVAPHGDAVLYDVELSSVQDRRLLPRPLTLGLLIEAVEQHLLPSHGPFLHSCVVQHLQHVHRVVVRLHLEALLAHRDRLDLPHFNRHRPALPPRGCHLQALLREPRAPVRPVVDAVAEPDRALDDGLVRFRRRRLLVLLGLDDGLLELNGLP
mmetsp:Transcript_32456/g.82016  ORF Transcript_32456/g.82016 Transcript_32456/m.82016 type:complete len:289 (+) Transcript_32456:554-1420(+)